MKGKFSETERAAAVAAICEAYEAGHSLTDATKAAGTCARTFQLWRKEFADVADHFEKAVTARRESRRETLADLTETGFTTLLKGGRTVRRIYRYESGKRYLAQLEITDHPPNVTALIFLAKVLLGYTETIADSGTQLIVIHPDDPCYNMDYTPPQPSNNSNH